ncbi:MAG: trimethylamine methyltransferase family protein, partial [Candidatus Omnitrophota bacterium]
SYISARRPGLQAVFERFLKAVGYSALADGHLFGFAGNGNLDNGSMFSPEQFLLDLEIMEGLDSLWTAPDVPPVGDTAARISEAILKEGGNFLTSEHTLRHYRDEMWNPGYFQYLASTRNEKEILDRCHADYRAMVEDYRPVSHPDEVIRELKRIIERARQNLF